VKMLTCVIVMISIFLLLKRGDAEGQKYKIIVWKKSWDYGMLFKDEEKNRDIKVIWHSSPQAARQLLHALLPIYFGIEVLGEPTVDINNILHPKGVCTLGVGDKKYLDAVQRLSKIVLHDASGDKSSFKQGILSLLQFYKRLTAPSITTTYEEKKELLEKAEDFLKQVKIGTKQESLLKWQVSQILLANIQIAHQWCVRDCKTGLRLCFLLQEEKLKGALKFVENVLSHGGGMVSLHRTAEWYKVVLTYFLRGEGVAKKEARQFAQKSVDGASLLAKIAHYLFKGEPPFKCAFYLHNNEAQTDACYLHLLFLLVVPPGIRIHPPSTRYLLLLVYQSALARRVLLINKPLQCIRTIIPRFRVSEKGCRLLLWWLENRHKYPKQILPKGWDENKILLEFVEELRKDKDIATKYKNLLDKMNKKPKKH